MQCQNCQQAYEITDQDRQYYTKIKVPEPTWCPTCREQHRLAFRNERHLYRRTCTKCQKKIISSFHADVPFPVYCGDCWWSDDWDPLQYGQPFDFNRPFFEQFAEILDKTPKIGMIVYQCENCDFNSFIGICKNCYLSAGSYNCEDCYYCRKCQYCNHCMDGLFLDHCELCYQSVYCKNCYQGNYLVNCKNCIDSSFLADCNSCQNCFMCSGLRHQKFHIQNQPYSEPEYRQKIAELKKQPAATILQEFLRFNQTIPKKDLNLINCENCLGDYLQNCKNAAHAFDCFDLEDCKHCTESNEGKDLMDCTILDKNNELCYEICAGGDKCIDVKFSFCPVNVYNCEYLYNCVYVQHCFGCDSLPRRMEHCILNQKYSPEEYTALREKIIAHMQQTGEYGKFFPAALSRFAYNETVTPDYFPLDKNTALAKGYKWRDE